jgi:hypothetical protein
MKIIKVKMDKTFIAIFLITIILILPFNSISSSSFIKQTSHEKDKELFEIQPFDNNDIVKTQKKSFVRNEKLIILESLIKLVKQSFAFDYEIRFLCNQALTVLGILPDAVCKIILYLILPIAQFFYDLTSHPNYFVTYYARIIFNIVMITYLIFCDYPYYYINSKSTFNYSIISDNIISSDEKRCPCLTQIKTLEFIEVESI